jgi:glycosidase
MTDMNKPYYPSLFQVNTRVWLTALSQRLNRLATLDDIPDLELDRIKSKGFDWIWFLSVWQTGAAGRKISRENEGWRKEFAETLPDLKEEDIAGSGFAITGYKVPEEIGGNDALSRLHKRLNDRGLKLMLDFVPNHMAIDHPWVSSHPDFFIRGTKTDLERTPDNYIKIEKENGEIILAHGRDPFFPGWPDTLQLNYSSQLLQEEMIGELKKISQLSDGVRCDMAMLVLPDVFERTWGLKSQPFWPKAIKQTHEINPGFCFMAEVYWDLEWTMIQNGFDYAYDKRLYDRLKEGHPRPVKEHLHAGLDYQGHMARFLENHDEPRVAAEFPEGKHEAAAVITFLSPGLRFFHNGQFEGARKKISPHLVRGPEEQVNNLLESFYDRLTGILQLQTFRTGNWQLLQSLQAWEGNRTFESYISFAWNNGNGEKILVSVNYSSKRSQCYIKLPFSDLNGSAWLMKDLLSETAYEREGCDLHEKGMYLDEPAWKAYVFLMQRK